MTLLDKTIAAHEQRLAESLDVTAGLHRQLAAANARIAELQAALAACEKRAALAEVTTQLGDALINRKHQARMAELAKRSNGILSVVGDDVVSVKLNLKGIM